MLMLKTRRKKCNCAWEEGGNGEATIICNPSGYALDAYRVANELNGRHALLPVNENYLIVRYKVAAGRFLVERVTADLGLEVVFNGFEWFIERPRMITRAFMAAMYKAMNNECTIPYYTKDVVLENNSREFNNWTW